MSTFIACYRFMFLIIMCLSIPFAIGFFTLISFFLGKSEKSELGNLKICSSIMRIFLKISFIEVICHPKIESRTFKNTLLLSNHVSYLDIVALQALYPLSFLGKLEIKSWPVFGYLAKKIATIFVDRASMMSRIQCIRQIKDRLKRSSVALFPEGTTSQFETPLLDCWSAGHLLALTPGESRLVLAGFYYENHRDMAWVDDMDLLPHLWETLKKPRIRIFLSTMEYIPSRQEFSNLRVLARNVSWQVSELCLESKRRAALLNNERDYYRPIKLEPSDEYT